FYKRKSSSLFYRLMNLVSDVEIRRGASDFRLLDRSVVDVLKDMNESHIFMRGLIPWLGFRECSIRYAPGERLSGASKYSTARMLAFGMDGITSFSTRPLQISTLIGGAVSLSTFLYGLVAILARLILGREVSGWASVIVSVLFIGGLQLLMLGIFGQYLGKVFVESKKRPNYVIRERKLQTVDAKRFRDISQSH
ncbi:MAG: glycosyltransferase, partial [Dissulfurispiraceae bacterium]